MGHMGHIGHMGQMRNKVTGNEMTKFVPNFSIEAT